MGDKTMTWNDPPKIDFKKNKFKAKSITPEQLAATDTEDAHQAALFCWAAQNIAKYPQLSNMFAIPNGGSRHIAEAVKFVGTGTRKGVPDIFLAWPVFIKDQSMISGKSMLIYHGLFIEMKKEIYRNRKNGGRNDEQLKWGIELINAGYRVVVCYNWMEARDELIAYLESEL